MKNILKYKWIVSVVLIILFLFTILISFQFFQKEDQGKEVLVDPIVLPNDEDLEFFNSSSFQLEELKAIVSQKKEELRALFYDSSIYQLIDIDSSKTEEENKKYTVLDDTFLQRLNEIVTENIYSNIFNKMTLLKNDGNHTFYMMEKNSFDSIYLNSAIAQIDVDSESIRFISATDDKINASVTLYRENELGDSYPFELIREQEKWKINAFQK